MAEEICQLNPLFSGFMHLAAGLSVGLTGLAAGYAIGVVGDVVSVDIIHRTRLELTASREYDHICSNQEYLWVWF